MTAPKLAIQVDPFFDTPRDVTPPGYAGKVTGDVRYTHGTGYHDIASGNLVDGRPMSAVMRQGKGGLTGTIVPRATEGGVPFGERPHETAGLVVTIDPHLKGQSVQVTLGDITAESLKQANVIAAQQGLPLMAGIEGTRLQASAVLHGVAAQSHRPQLDLQPPVQAGPAVPNIPATNLSKIAMPVQPPQSNAQLRPLSHFVKPSAQAPQTVVTSPTPQLQQVNTAVPVYQPIESPKRKVIFEIERFGRHVANFHDVIVVRENNFLVLVYDTRFDGEMYTPHMPPPGEKGPDMAMQEIGTREVYLVEPTGLHYSHGCYEYCILLIQRVAESPE